MLKYILVIFDIFMLPQVLLSLESYYCFEDGIFNPKILSQIPCL